MFESSRNALMAGITSHNTHFTSLFALMGNDLQQFFPNSTISGVDAVKQEMWSNVSAA